MAAESILTYKRPSFPVVDKTTSGTRTTIEYIGPTATIEAAVPARNAAWGDYDGYVTNTRLEPIENTGYSVLAVNMEQSFSDESGSSGDTQGTLIEVQYEVEWTMFQRSLFEHPVFRPGGIYGLTSADVAAIERWKNNTDAAKKGEYQYKVSDDGATYETLSTNAQKFAQGINLGQENYEDFAPVVRKTSTYADGMPGQSDAGLKNNPPSFVGGPAGYEWRKSADRAVRAEKETQWDRVEEWVGAIRVLSDKQNIYW